MSLLAFIPARSGSKGIPRKNVVLLNGKPLIEYTIRAALESRCVDEILLSTDDEEISEVGHKLGLDVSYRRPKELAGDETSMIETMRHGLRWLESKKGALPKETLLLQPTSPLRTAEDIDKATIQFRHSDALALVSVHPMSEHPSECIAFQANRWNYLVLPAKGVVRRQDYDNIFYFINGAIYLSRTTTLLDNRSFIVPEKTDFYQMPRERGVDIDTPLDLKIAESIMNFKVQD